MSNHSSDSTDQAQLRHRLVVLHNEHRDLDDLIARMSNQIPADQLQLQRLKKRKLVLKDEMIHVENLLMPDIIA